MIEADGLEALRSRIGVKQIAGWIEKTARWVDPATFRLLPVWYPEHARGKLFYKDGWSKPQMNTTKISNVAMHKKEGNIYANHALSQALGLKKKDRPNWSCCHIWGVDDDKFQKSNAVVQDHRFYSCVANMVLLPTPLKAFTDAMPEIKAMLRLCAWNLYAWRCDHPALDDQNAMFQNIVDHDDYPSSWPRRIGEKKPDGVVELTDIIRATAMRRLRRVWCDLAKAGDSYPRDDVRRAMQYWEDHLNVHTCQTDRPPLTNDLNRFAANAADFTPLGRIVETIDNTTPEQRERNAEHDAQMAKIRAELRAASSTGS